MNLKYESENRYMKIPLIGKIEKFAKEHPVITTVVVITVTMGIAYLLSRKSTGSDTSEIYDESGKSAFNEETVYFVDGSSAYTTPNHSKEDLIRDNYDIYN